MIKCLSCEPPQNLPQGTLDPDAGISALDPVFREAPLSDPTLALTSEYFGFHYRLTLLPAVGIPPSPPSPGIESPMGPRPRAAASCRSMRFLNRISFKLRRPHTRGFNT